MAPVLLTQLVLILPESDDSTALPKTHTQTAQDHIFSCIYSTAANKPSKNGLNVLVFDEHPQVLWVAEGLEALAQDSLRDAARQIVNVQYLALVLQPEKGYEDISYSIGHT